jgi:carbonic anhydrase
MCDKKLNKLLENNKKWVASRLKFDPDFFEKLSEQHSPEYLWIGCSDARVPANTIIGVDPGEVFVHRNVGNVISHSDSNIRAVIGYAVEVLKVKHIIVTGHYGCGAVKASLSSDSFGTVDSWVHNIRQVIRENDKSLNGLSGEEQERKLCELNVRTQVRNLTETTMVQEAWANGQDLIIHGWIYDIKDGLLKDLDCVIANNKDAEKLEISKVVKDL